MEDTLKLIPLGGCGEIGMNMTILVVDNRYFFIDCGALFPDPSLSGVDLIVPSCKYLKDNNIYPEAWLITHGHEDHIGALPAIFPHFPAPIYGTEFTIELIRSKFEEARIQNYQLHVWQPFVPTYFKQIRVTPFPVNHSIPDSAGLFIESHLGNLLHSGDFRIDENPPEKSQTHDNLKKVLRGKSVDLMISDSTNAFAAGTDASESSTFDALKDIMQTSKGAVLIATFASNIWRLQNIIHAARESKRKVVLLGRSMERNFSIALKLGLIEGPTDIMRSQDSLNQIPRNELCVICTGSQGEPFAALYRMAWDPSPPFHLTPEDTVIFSSRIIPGNERSIESLIIRLDRIGVKVITSRDNKHIHVSGHGYQEDLLKCIEMAKPRAFLPIHGTYFHLKKHRQLATKFVPEESCYFAENGDVISFGTKKNEGVIGSVFAGRDYVALGGLYPSDSEIFKERAQLNRIGIFTASFVIDNKDHSLISDPLFSARGLPNLTNHTSKELERVYDRVWRLYRKKRNYNFNQFHEEVRSEVRKFIDKKFNYKPVISVILHQV